MMFWWTSKRASLKIKDEEYEGRKQGIIYLLYFRKIIPAIRKICNSNGKAGELIFFMCPTEKVREIKISL
jgi:hypothetical protein